MGAIYDSEYDYRIEMNVLISVDGGEVVEGTLVAHPGDPTDHSVSVYTEDGVHIAERYEMTWLDKGVFEAEHFDEDGDFIERFRVWTLVGCENE